MNIFHPTYALVANGDLGDEDDFIISRIQWHEGLIAVDGGLAHCHRLGLRPDLIVGDLDSISPDLLDSDIPVRSFPREKDQSDLELALQSCYTPTIERITVFGALGKRIDHTLSNLHLLRRYPNKVFFETREETVFAFDDILELNTTPGQTISFIPMGEVSGVTSQGLRWELVDANFSKYFYSLSNICLGNQVRVAIESGDLICILSSYS